MGIEPMASCNHEVLSKRSTTELNPQLQKPMSGVPYTGLKRAEVMDVWWTPTSWRIAWQRLPPVAP